MKTPESHHSLADWDYRPGAYITISGDRYVSYPSALRTIIDPPETTYEWLYLKDALAHNIPDGRILDWRYFDTASAIIAGGFLFRCQDISFTDWPLNCYYIQFTPLQTLFCANINGVRNVLYIYEHRPYADPDTWYHTRISFFQHIEADFAVYLRVVFEIQVNAQWTELWSFNHHANLWKDSDINRIGFMCRAFTTNFFQYIDDTQILEKT